MRIGLPASADFGMPESTTTRASFFEVFSGISGESGERSFAGRPMMVDTAEDAASARERPSGSATGLVGDGGLMGEVSEVGCAVFFLGLVSAP